MDELQVLNIEEIAKILGDQSLNDKDFKKSELLNLNFGKPVEDDHVSYAFGLNGSFNVQLFNSTDDTDQDNVIGSNADSIIPASADKAWLKYQAISTVSASNGLEASYIGFDFSSEKTLQFSGYRLHDDLNAPLKDAVIGDFKPFLFIANFRHLTKLKPGEVLTAGLSGKLDLEVSVTWSDIFTGALAAFQQLAPATDVLNITLSANIKAAFKVSIVDNCSLQVRKNDDGTYQVYFFKSASQNAGGSVAAGIEVGFKDENAAKAVLGAVVEGLIGKLKGKIQPILDKNPLTKLSDAELQLVAEAAKSLHFDPSIITTVADLEGTLQTKLTPVIEGIAKAKIRLGFAYEYNRTSTSREILQAKLTEDALQKYHSGLIRFKLSGHGGNKGLLTDLREAENAGQPLDGVTLVNYMNEKTISRKRAWGFSLGISKWVIAGKDSIDVDETIRQNVQGNRQIAFKGTRGYDGNLLGFQENWTVDFNAEMDNFSQQPTPKTNELKYGLYLLKEWKRNKDFNSENIHDIADHAVLWKAIDQTQFDAVTGQLRDAVSGRGITNVQASVHLKFSPDIFPAVFNNIAYLVRKQPQKATKIIADSLAAAMAYYDDYAIRKTVASRINGYAPLWVTCLLKNGKTESDEVIEQEERIALGYAAQKRLRDLREPALARFETDPDTRNEAGSLYFSNVLAGHAGIRSAWSSFKAGITQLSDGYLQGLPYEDITHSAFKDMQYFWSQEHYVRTVGHYLLTFADNDVLMQGIERALTVSYEKDGEQKTIQIIGKLS